MPSMSSGPFGLLSTEVGTATDHFSNSILITLNPEKMVKADGDHMDEFMPQLPTFFKRSKVFVLDSPVEVKSIFALNLLLRTHPEEYKSISDVRDSWNYAGIMTMKQELADPDHMWKTSGYTMPVCMLSGAVFAINVWERVKTGQSVGFMIAKISPGDPLKRDFFQIVPIYGTREEIKRSALWYAGTVMHIETDIGFSPFASDIWGTVGRCLFKATKDVKGVPTTNVLGKMYLACEAKAQHEHIQSVLYSPAVSMVEQANQRLDTLISSVGQSEITYTPSSVDMATLFQLVSSRMLDKLRVGEGVHVAEPDWVLLDGGEEEEQLAPDAEEIDAGQQDRRQRGARRGKRTVEQQRGEKPSKRRQPHESIFRQQGVGR